MIIKNNEIYKQSITYLQQALRNPNAQFREGQYEAIEAVFTNKRSLVVQKTGWGKSFVYFISTKINRNKGKGISIVISPLLVLIENQIEAAEKMGLKCEAIYSSNRESHGEIIERMKQNRIDILFTTPESLFNVIREHLSGINLGMFIIDEAHC
ncbi:MAG: DEAD/DEAH box helicase, partial [Firmicutes bacterium]|nr:DEAD/DEAH box helicase [Bacillota bacterium]